MFLIRFYRSLTKKDSVDSAKYERTNFFSSCTSVFGRFFSWIRIRTREKSLIRILNKTGILNTAVMGSAVRSFLVVNYKILYCSF